MERVNGAREPHVSVARRPRLRARMAPWFPRAASAACAACVTALALAGAARTASAPPTRFALPAGALRLSDSSLPAGSRARVTFSVTLDRRVTRGRLALTLPSLWTRRATSGIAYASLPRRGHGSSARSSVTRDGRVVRFAFTSARTRDSGSFDVRDNGIPAGTYRLAYSWLEGGRTTARGTARVVFAARSRPRR
jgi:hypothetical protein